MSYPTETILECINISKSFGSLEILKDLNIKITAGERRAILGPNGAGKTTLFNIICGELSPSSGQIFIHGKDVSKQPSYTRIRYGFSRTFQLTNLFFDMSVVENVIIAIFGCRRWKLLHWKPIRLSKELYTQASELLQRFSLKHLLNEKAKNLSYGDQRLLEIVLALCSSPSILALDEPSSGLSAAETQKLIQVLKTLDPKITLVFIEHDMDLVSEVARTVTVLHQGTTMAEGTIDEIKDNSLVRDVYMGVGNFVRN